MQKYVNGEAVSNIFVGYVLPASDVLFFLFSSVQLSVLKERTDYLLRFYHECFINTLRDLRCDTEPFNYENFLEELRLEAEYEIPHVMFISVFVVNIGDKTEEYDGNDFPREKILPLLNRANRERAQFITLEFARRGWLS